MNNNLNRPTVAQPPQPPPASSKSIELLQAIVNQLEIQTGQLGELIATLASLTEIIIQASNTAAATVTPAYMPPASPAIAAGPFVDFTACAIVYSTDDNGRPVYKVKGADMYQKHGVRIWPEILPALGVDINELQPGQNYLTPVVVRALLENGSDGQPHPRKVIGLGTGTLVQPVTPEDPEAMPF